MQRFILLISAILLSLAWLSPDHYTPWLTFSSEMFAFASMMCLLALYYDQPLEVPKLQVGWMLVVLIPLIQWCFSIELYFSKALLSSSYLFAFGMVVVLGHNMAKDYEKRSLFTAISVMLFIVGFITSIIALLQWFDLEKNIWGLMELKGNRPYANFAQPNNMATFLLMSLMGALYVFEKRSIPVWLTALGAGIILFCIALSQSRTPWIACIVLSCYFLLKHKHDSYHFSKKHLLLWVLLYLNCLLWIPYLNSLLVDVGISQAQMSDIVQRANTSHSRFGIWKQMLYAIREQPWLGYGWNQTGMAQLVGADYVVHSERTNSAHNIVLEIVVWNGIILGTCILAYFAYWLWTLNRVVRSKETLIASLIVLSVAIHAMLEFPQNYAYFLLPVAFLLGFIQSETTSSVAFKMKGGVNTCILIVCILLYGLIWRDYIHAVDGLSDGSKHTDAGLAKQPATQVFMLTEYSARAEWYYLDRFTHLTPQELLHFHRAVLVSPSHYDLYKYAQLLAFNGQSAEAMHQLTLIQGLYRMKHDPKQLTQRSENQN